MENKIYYIDASYVALPKKDLKENAINHVVQLPFYDYRNTDKLIELGLLKNDIAIASKSSDIMFFSIEITSTLQLSFFPDRLTIKESGRLDSDSEKLPSTHKDAFKAILEDSRDKEIKAIGTNFSYFLKSDSASKNISESFFTQKLNDGFKQCDRYSITFSQIYDANTRINIAISEGKVNYTLDSKELSGIIVTLNFHNDIVSRSHGVKIIEKYSEYQLSSVQKVKEIQKIMGFIK